MASFFDVPAIEQKVLAGRDSGQVAAAAARYGWAESKPSTGQLRVLDCQGIAEFGAPFDSPDS